MTCQEGCNQFDLAMELLIDNGFSNVVDVVEILMNTAMQIERSRHLQAIPYERTEAYMALNFLSLIPTKD